MQKAMLPRPDHQLSFEDLHIFARIANLGSMSAVAQERNVPVSQITRALQRIESAYGVRMVHRSTHALSLTPEGQLFLAHCQRMDDAHHLLETDLGLASRDIRGVVRISASAVFANHVLIPGLASLRDKHPRLIIDLRVDDRLIDMARDGIDMALRTAMPTSELLVQRRLGEFRRALYASPAYLAKHGIPKDLQDLEQHTIITNSRAGHPNVWQLKAKYLKQMPKAGEQLLTDNSQTLLDMTLTGLGIARMSDIVCQPLVKQGRLVQVLPKLDVFEDAATPINAVMLSERHRLPKVRACIEHWVTYFADIAER